MYAGGCREDHFIHSEWSEHDVLSLFSANGSVSNIAIHQPNFSGNVVRYEVRNHLNAQAQGRMCLMALKAPTQDGKEHHEYSPASASPGEPSSATGQDSNLFYTTEMQVAILGTFFAYLAVLRSVLPGKVIPGAVLPDGTRLHYLCNGLLSLLLLVGLLGLGSWMNSIDPTIIAERGLELLSATFICCILVTLALYAGGVKSKSQTSSLKPHISGNFVHDWWFGIQLNPQCMGIDLKFFFVRAGMMG
ncbi:hypothetical protein SAY87_009005 [Trapa incisa]|uniref:Uncharacterized protein n=1 Tax=Trapa incisa TaxID=236973 RepID=A0AAN7JV36_9MYRT|nr:hypothetical protein SAY87_009005 [Trapa incisa]